MSNQTVSTSQIESVASSIRSIVGAVKASVSSIKEASAAAKASASTLAGYNGQEVANSRHMQSVPNGDGTNTVTEYWKTWSITGTDGVISASAKLEGEVADIENSLAGFEGLANNLDSTAEAIAAYIIDTETSLGNEVPGDEAFNKVLNQKLGIMLSYKNNKEDSNNITYEEYDGEIDYTDPESIQSALDYYKDIQDNDPKWTEEWDRATEEWERTHSPEAAAKLQELREDAIGLNKKVETLQLRLADSYKIQANNEINGAIDSIMDSYGGAPEVDYTDPDSVQAAIDYYESVLSSEELGNLAEEVQRPVWGNLSPNPADVARSRAYRNRVLSIQKMQSSLNGRKFELNK